MANLQRVAEQVHGILSRSELPFRAHEDGTSFRIPYESAAVFLDIREVGGLTVVQLRSFVLQNLDASAEQEAVILHALNEANRDGWFGTLWYDQEMDVVVLEHHLLGDELESVELLNALSAVAIWADRLDDEFMLELGTGERAIDVEARQLAEQSPEPPVSA